jgi:hypothetical protein
MEIPMFMTIVWDNKPIPNDEPHKAIDELGLAPVDTEHLWALWAALDALIEKEDVGIWDDAEPEVISDLVSHPDFVNTANENEAANVDGYGRYDWSGLPGWVIDHAHKLEFVAA